MENNNYENPTPTLPLDAQPPEEPKKPNNKKLFLFGGIVLGLILIGLGVFFIIKSNTPSEPEPETASELSPDGLTEEELAELDLPTDENGKIISQSSIFDDEELSVNIKEGFFEGEDIESYVEEALYEFLVSVYPEYSSVTVLPNSLKNNSFKLKVNTGAVYLVDLSYASTDAEFPDLSVKTEDGKEVFSYSEDSYTGDDIVLTDEQAEEIFGDSEE
ncbi:hypothetical protein IJH66_02495 [Candidatus Saccharibacteria bacterium]|nr:hypothetical protein [Candidatus Saccharibacteria bacterium]